MLNDILGNAILDFYHHGQNEPLWILNHFRDKESMPVGMYFRTYQDMPEMELHALESCAGKILEVGGGAGSHALLLQEEGYEVHVVEISPKACQVMTSRGVKHVIWQDIFNYQGSSFDTILLIMNGIGLTGTLDGLERFLLHAAGLLRPGGQLIFDSSDVKYLYRKRNLPTTNYYGEVDYCYEYKGQQGEWFKWLYVDMLTLKKIALKTGWNTEITFEDEHDQYLARLTRVNNADQ